MGWDRMYGLKPRKSSPSLCYHPGMTTQAEATPPIDATALWHAIGRLEDGQRQTAYAIGRLEEGQQQLSQRMDRMEQSFNQRMDRMEQSFNQRMDRMDQRMDRLDQGMDRLEKRIERLLYAGVAVGGAILAAVIVGQFFG